MRRRAYFVTMDLNEYKNICDKLRELLREFLPEKKIPKEIKSDMISDLIYRIGRGE